MKGVIWHIERGLLINKEGTGLPQTLIE